MEFDGKPGGTVGSWGLRKSPDSWSWTLHSPPPDELLRVGAGPAHVLAVNSPLVDVLIATANYANGSWNVFGQIDKKEPFQIQEKWGPGCRNGTSHPHETVR